MKTVVLNLPDSVDLDAKQVSLLLAVHLYEKRTLTLGQAAQLSGLSKRSFAETLGMHGVSLFNYDAADVFSDVSNA